MSPTIYELLTVAFWSIAYILIIAAGFFSRKSKQISMPYLPGVLDFAWELCAFIRGGFYGHLIWLALDVIIVIFGIVFLADKKRIAIYVISLLVASIAFSYVFSLFNGMFYSGYLLCIVITLSYLVQRRNISPVFKTTIAGAKLLGDLAGLFTLEKAPFLTGVMIFVFLCNLIYLILCLRDYILARKRVSA